MGIVYEFFEGMKTEHVLDNWLIFFLSFFSWILILISGFYVSFFRTNLPKEVMAFPDFPFPEGDESFLHHSEVQKYLEDYAQHFDLYPHIKVIY